MDELEFGYLYRFQNRDDNDISAIYVNKGIAIGEFAEETAYVVHQFFQNQTFISVLPKQDYEKWLKALLESHYRIGRWELTKCSS